MRLLNVLALRSEEFIGGNVPQYAILSHTWGEDEISFHDLQLGRLEDRGGFDKLKYSAQQTLKDGLQYIWMDTCCIDKTSSAELSEAVNSMFRWYQAAQHCYVYLGDVSRPAVHSDDNQWVSVASKAHPIDQVSGSLDDRWSKDFSQSRWFTRGWTLQELLAPSSVLFFSREWTFLGDKESLMTQISRVTGIDAPALHGRSLSLYTVEERMAWARSRQTTRVEDGAYCLLGIFDVYMPMIYGEGERAFERLAREIANTTSGYKFLRPKDRTIVLQGMQRSSNKIAAFLVREPADGDQVTKETNKHTIPSHTRTPAPRHAIGPTPLPQDRGSSQEDISRGSHDESTLSTDSPDPGLPGTTLADSQLRILTLNPGMIGDKLEGQVQQFSFSNAPSYYALSYTWGQEPDLHPIFLQDQMRLIRSNLFHALQRIRLRSGPIHIWIDSICINQEDDLERNSQVRQMADIYRSATGVLIWLGEEDSTSKLAMDLIEKIVRPEYSWRGPWWNDYGFVALARVLERPWFRRRWVLQEAAMSSNSTVYCGDRQIYMDAFSMAVNLVRARLSTATPPDAQNDQTSPVAFLAIFRDSPAVRLLDTIDGAFRRSDDGAILHRLLSLETLVDLARFSDTSDCRDTIYSLLSLSRDAAVLSNSSSRSDLMINPDYSKSVLDVYADFVLHCISHSGLLNIICRPWAPVLARNHASLGHSPRTSEAGPLPSWIATRDRLPFGDPSLQLTQRLHGNPLVGSSQKRVYNCHFSAPPQVRIGRDSQNKCDGSLYAKGFIVGTVAKRSMRMANAMLTKECLQLLGSATLKTSAGSFSVSVSDAIWRVICADRDDKGDAPPPFYRSAMTHLLQLSLEKSDDSFDAANLLNGISSIDVEELLDTDLNDHVRTFLEIVRDVIWNRRTFQTHPEVGIDGIKRPYVGLIPQAAKIGDTVCILHGCSVPVVLRKAVQSESTIHWQLIGDAYVYGVMDGELIQFRDSSRLEEKEMEFEIR